MSQYLSEVLTDTVETEPVAASGGTGGASAPILKEGDIKPAKKGKELKLPTAETASKKVKYSAAVEKSIVASVESHNVSCSETRKATDDMFRSVYRRGAGSFNAAAPQGLNRHSWAMKRVNAFATLLSNETAASTNYTADYDLLPITHPRSKMALYAAGVNPYSDFLTVTLHENEEEYASQEHAIFSLAEFSGLGYETIPAIRAAWMRGIKNNENPFERAAVLASALYDSPDADLLPKKGTL